MMSGTSVTMTNTTTPLTNTEVKQAKPKAKEYNLADGGGLALRVKPNGSKLWVFNYTRPYSKKRANLGYGTYPEVSLAQARRKRDQARELLAQDIDPKQHKEEQHREQAEANANTLTNVVEQWFEVKQTQITPSYAEDIIRVLVFPQLYQQIYYAVER